MDKMKMETDDIAARNVERIGELFPNCITEMLDEEKSTPENKVYKKAINFELLKQMLSGDVIDGDEAYEFTWVGKKASIVEANKPIRKTLRPCKEESVNWDTTENLYIEGDNLEVLKLLQESYLGKVKMIYIDPPYNTGNDFIYRDDFKMSSEEYDDESGALDEEGNRLFKNTDSNGRFHSDWCSMIYSRLMLARNLLSDDGVIFISIDDNEQENLKKICDEVFGASNFVNFVCLKAKASAGASGGGEDKRLKKNIEFIYIYSKNKYRYELTHPENYIKISDFIEEHKKNKIGFYYTRILISCGQRKLLRDTGKMKIYLHQNFVFSTINEVMEKEKISLNEAYAKYFDKIFMVTNAQTSLLEKVNKVVNDAQQLVSYEYIPSSGKEKGNIVTKYVWNKTLVVWFADSAVKIDKEVYKKIQIGTLWDDISWGRLDLQGDVPFKNGKKPLKMLERIIKTNSSNDIILDFFSGSSTTAHAVMQLNAEDGGNRKFIMVQLPEQTDEKSEAYKAGYKNICEIGKERIRRAGKKILEENKDKEGIEKLDIGFRVLKLDDSNMKDVFYSPNEYSQDLLSALESNVKSDRGDLDLLFGCLLEWGLPLSLPYHSEPIGGCTIHNYNDGDLMACFDEKISEEVIRAMAKRQPLRAVFRDGSFADSPSKINVKEIFKSLSPDTRVKVL